MLACGTLLPYLQANPNIQPQPGSPSHLRLPSCPPAHLPCAPACPQVLAILRLLGGFRRVLYVDLDIHHCDAVQVRLLWRPCRPQACTPFCCGQQQPM